MHRVYIDRKPEVVHGRHGEPGVLVRLGGHPDDRWREVFLDQAFEGGLAFPVELRDNALWLTVRPGQVAAALDWLAARTERVNEASDVREHRVLEHALERAVHDWWATNQLRAV